MKFLADENVREQLIRGLLLRQPDFDIVRVQDVGLQGLKDPQVLAWAADHGRILITFDVRTMPDFAYQRIAEGQALPGVIAISSAASLGQAIEDLLTVEGASTPGELEGRVIRIPI